MKWTTLRIAVFSICLLLISTFGIASEFDKSSTTKDASLAAPIPVQVKVTVSNSNWVETISVCNISPNTILLDNIELDFNYAVPMPTNIWGDPWAAWRVKSQTGNAVVLLGGTPWTPSMPPDPTCVHPLTIQFSAAPTAPAPTGPFVFKATGGQPVEVGILNITLPVAPVPGLQTPTISVSGPNGVQQKAVNWGSAWQLTNLMPGAYTITSSPVNNTTAFYAAPTINTTISANQTNNQTIAYKKVPTGKVTVTLVRPPNALEPITFTGKTYTFNNTVSNGMVLTLPTDVYVVTSVVAGYTSTVSPNPISVPTNTALTVSYTKNPSTGGGPYTVINGQIVDGNKNPVTFQGVNWFGFNTGNHIVHGLWQSDFDTMVNQMKTLGFNAVRLPFAFDFILDATIKPNGITTSCGGKPCNLDVPQDSALNAFQWVVKKFTDNGFYVLLDDHYEDDTYVNNYANWLAGWKKIAQLFVNNPQVGYDLWNEPDSHNLLWEAGGTPWTKGITDAATAIYSIDTSKLIFVEGTAQGALKSNWGDGFATDDAAVAQGVSNPKAFFTQLINKPYVNQIVISPHMYGPDGTNGQGPDHSDPTTAFADWSRLNGYLYNNFLNINNTSQSGFCISGTCHLYPIALGEFGGKFDPNDPNNAKDTATNINIANYLVRLGNGKPAIPSWFYWDWNPNSGNTGGILKDDWATIDCNKVNYLKKYLFLKPNAGICM